MAAGLHPRASDTTVAIARDLTERMDFDSGQVRYCLDGMVARLGVSRATISRHVAFLRDVGALVWVERGSRANVRRARGLGGYAGTATVYAAVIPAVYDQAHGHTVVGSGYTARIVIDQRGTAPAPAQGSEAVDNRPVDNPSSAACETPSRTGVKEVGQLQVVGGCRDISRKRASRSKTRISRQSTLINDRRRTANDVRRAERTVRLVRALVPWTQTVPLRRLEYVMRPLTDRTLDAHEIAADLTVMCPGVRWRPLRPDVFIAQRLAAANSQDQPLARGTGEAPAADRHAVAPMSNSAWAAWIEQRGRSEAISARPRTDDDRAAARATWNNWPSVADHYAEDPDDAIDLYGLRLCQFALARAKQLEGRGFV
ncbi:hypothetical protein [Streptomyces melanogenes]|uniref:hypothetical protein n=1 Tax=Streptomyces melanogenes TaxID=67326 RepID=UPI0037921B98